jgi:O-antigen ligase
MQVSQQFPVSTPLSPTPSGAFSNAQSRLRQQIGSNAPLSVASLILGIYLALHACAAPEFITMYWGLPIKVVAPLAVIVLIMGLASGRVSSFFKVPIALPYFVMLVIWLFSMVLFTFKGEWGNLIQYSFRYHLLPVMMCAIMNNFNSLRTVMSAYTVGFLFTILFCFLYGYPDSAGRFHIPDTSFQNPNDLAFNLLFGVSHLTFWIRRRSILLRVIAALAILPAIYYVLKTGSRANLVVLVALIGTLFVISNARMRVATIIFVIFGAVGATFVLPQQTLVRLTSFTSATQEDLSKDEHLVGAIGSTEARKNLQRRAFMIALHNPIIGVGPTMYIYALHDYMIKHENLGKGSWQRAHNTYLELAAETGIPSFLLYVGCLLWCIGINRRSLKLLKATGMDEDSQALSLALLLVGVTYLFGTAFCSITYTGTYCMYIAMSSANYLVVLQHASQHAAANAQQRPQALPLAASLLQRPKLTPAFANQRQTIR